MISIDKVLLQLMFEIRAFSQQTARDFGWLRSQSGLATKQDLRELANNIMSAISDFAAKQTEFNNRQAVAIDGIVVDVKALNDMIEKLQNNPGPISPEDQKLLDNLEVAGDALATRLEGLDSQTPPPVPVG